VVDSLPCTTLGSATKRLKESDLIVTRPSNNFSRYSFTKRNLEIQIQQFRNTKTTEDFTMINFLKFVEKYTFTLK
jgi:hypothetical protein